MTGVLLSLLLATGVVEGRVVSSADGLGVSDALVRVDSLTRQVRTDRDGGFRLEGLAPGRWVLRISAPRFRDRVLAVRVPRTGTVTVEVELEPEPGSDPVAGSGTLGGTVVEEERRVAVPSADVELVEPGLRTRSDTAGAFRLERVPAGTWTLRLSAPGYRVVERAVRIRVGRTRSVVLALEPLPFPLKGVEVLRHRLGNLVLAERTAVRVVDSARVDLLPAPVERDLLRTVQTLPSVTPSSDFSSALYVRGGTPDQTRLFIDGAPIHNPFHVGGFVSAFTPSATEGIVLRPGGLPASIPSSLAGTMEIHTVRGARDSLRVHGSTGLLSSSLTADGPLPGTRGTTFLASARRTYVDVVSAAAEAVGLVDGSFPYGFTDGLARVTADLGPRASLSGLGYLDRESFGDAATGGVEALHGTWQSDVLSLRGQASAGERIRWEGGVATSGFGADIRRGTRRLGSGDGMAEETSRADLSLRTVAFDGGVTAALGAHALSAGFRWERNAIRHRVAGAPLDADYVPEMTADGRYGGTALFVREQWEPAGGWFLDGGLRLERPGGRGWQLLPRVRLARRLGPAVTLGVGGGRYVQDWWSLRDEESAYTGVVAYDVTVPVPNAYPLPTGWDLTTDARAEVGGWELRLDAFHKELRHVPTAKPRNAPVDGPILLHPDSVETGRATVRGVELSGAGRWGDASLAFSYRWQQEERILAGLHFTPRSERRHRLVAMGTRPWGEREFAASLTWMSGAPFTPSELALPWVTEVGPDGRPVVTGSGLDSRVVYGAPNTARLPSYLRLDVSVRGDWDLTLFGRQGVLQPYVSVLNVLNRHNALSVEHDADGSRVLKRLGPQLPLLPSFGVRWRF